MINKKPNTFIGGFFKKGFKAFVAAELLACAAAYGFYHRCNSDRDFRFYLSENYPWALDYYYKTGELVDSHYRAREIDLEYWIKEGRKATPN